MIRAKQDAASKEARLKALARQALLAKGMAPDFPADVQAVMAVLNAPASPKNNERVDDLRELPWCSIDNEASKDLDQLSVAEELSSGAVRIRVALADVDALVPKSSSVDRCAALNTTSVYTPAQIFPMIPEKLSNDLTSLNFEAERLALSVEFEVAPSGEVSNPVMRRALVRNHAKLAYGSVGAWLENAGPLPRELEKRRDIAENIRIQERVARALKKLRHENGALDLESPEPKAAIVNGLLCYPGAARGNLAKLLIEDFMIAANGAGARFLASKGMPSIRRIVKTPKRWDRIVELARARGTKLPDEPDSKALEDFLEKSKASGLAAFQELSFNVMKLLGPGEYAVELPEGPHEGHFGLAVKDYAHSTAPNRRYADLVTHRLLKAALAGRPCPCSAEELTATARRCTLMEDAAKKIERQLNKSAVAMVIEDRIGHEFDAVVTGASDKGTWVRISDPPVEGRLAAGWDNTDVGDRLKVRLVHVNAELGHIDFKRIRG